MAHEHSIYDTDLHFVIDPVTRAIQNASGKIIFMQGDHKSERITFEIPRYIDGHDMSLCNRVEVHFENADKSARNANKSFYIVDDLQISPDSEDVVICSWLVGQEATTYAGTLAFDLRFACIPDALIEYQWFTNVYKGISIAESICNSETLVEDYPDAVAKIEAEIIEKIEGQSNKNETADSKYFDIDYDGIVSLKPEYRGSPESGSTPAKSYPACISDNGVGVDGSKNAELPECIVIPNNVNGQQVTGFEKGIFAYNHRIKKVVIPSNIKTINNGMFWYATNLESVENVEQVETVGNGAFHHTRVRELRFPNLTSLGSNAFNTCSRLKVVDIGNEITEIGNYTFQQCEDLTEVLGGEKVTVIRTSAFYQTRRLKTLPFIANVTTVYDAAFWSSRCDLEDLPQDCSLGDYSTYKRYEQNNVANFKDYWTEAKPFTPCKTPLKSLFHQKDPRWADKQIGNFYKKDENGNVTTEPVLYSSGCSYITLAEMYSAFENVNFNSPEEFIPILENALATKGLTNLDLRYRTDWIQAAEALGYETEYFSTMTTANLREIYNALADGALLYKSTMGKLENGNAATAVQGGHVHLGYGINTDGEMLVSDTSMHCYEIGIYENHQTAWHIYKHGSKECDCVIVKKPK